ncbi:MAG TPA: hypothetical protein VLT57_03990, partial [Bryobacteraceae bacterium]|nr:hypothetical protein [Bryobacteraceae bacterium]
MRLPTSLLLITFCLPAVGQPYYVATDGSDVNPGTLEQPFASLVRAQKAVRQKPGIVWLRGGTYYLPRTLVFSAEDSGTKANPVVFQAYRKEQPIVSGGIKLDNLDWRPYRNGIFQAEVPEDLRTEEIFINGERQNLARYPNFNSAAEYFGGFAADAISPERAARWAEPAGGYFHAMHPALWGDFTWRITGKDAEGKVTLEGGWQNNRGGAVHQKIRFVENIFEELDAPGEWFLDQKTHTIYFYPPAGLDLAHATVEATRLRSLVEFRGSPDKPVRFVVLRGLTFRHAARTVMDTKEPLLRTDWAIYRGGAVFFEGAEDCRLEDSFLDQVGGNAVFANCYNRRLAIRGCEIAGAGASGICFVGDPQAARNPLFNY